MKSNEEFIAGIYEKAAVYTEDKKIRKLPMVSRSMQIAAMFAVCLCLAGAGGVLFGNAGNSGETFEQPGENYGISLLAEGDETGNPMFIGRSVDGTILPEFITIWGTVEQNDYEAGILWIRLGYSEESGMQQLSLEERVLVPIKWNLFGLPEEITVGTSIQASGESVCENLPEYADWMLSVSEQKRLSVWDAETQSYRSLEDDQKEK